jgi:hypothetical protein
MQIAITLFSILLAISVLAYVAWRNQRRKEVWAKFAARNGLRHDDTRMWGDVREIPVSIFTETRGSGKNRSTYTVFEAAIPGSGLPLNLHVYREGVLSKVGKVFGGDDIELGIPEIDDRVIIKGLDVGEVRSYLSRPDVSRGLSDLINACRDLEIDPGRVHLEFRGALVDDARLQRSLDLLVDGTRAVAGLGYGALKYEEGW